MSEETISACRNGAVRTIPVIFMVVSVFFAPVVWASEPESGKVSMADLFQLPFMPMKIVVALNAAETHLKENHILSTEIELRKASTCLGKLLLIEKLNRNHPLAKAESEIHLVENSIRKNDHYRAKADLQNVMKAIEMYFAEK